MDSSKIFRLDKYIWSQSTPPGFQLISLSVGVCLVHSIVMQPCSFKLIQHAVAENIYAGFNSKFQIFKEIMPITKLSSNSSAAGSSFI